jgi:hypothetical protein
MDLMEEGNDCPVRDKILVEMFSDTKRGNMYEKVPPDAYNKAPECF